MAEAKKKLAKRQLKRINGQLKLVYIDVETGEVLSSLDGYELHTHGGFSNTDVTPPKEEEPKEEEKKPQQESGGGSDSSTRYKNQGISMWDPESDWSKKRSQGTGDIFKDFQAAGTELKRRMDSFGQGAKDALLGTAGKVVGAVTGKSEDTKKAVGAAAGDAARTAAGAVTDLANRAGDAIGGLFGGGDVQPAAYAPSGKAGDPQINWNGKDQGLTKDVTKTVAEAASTLSFGLNITSGARDPGHNAAVGGAKESEHIHGNAVDISIEGMNDAQKSALVASLIDSGATRIGAYSGNTSIHVDMKPVAPPEGYAAWPMFDRTIQNMGQAPAWFRETMKGNPLPEAQAYIVKRDKEPPSTMVADKKSGISPQLQQVVADYKQYKDNLKPASDLGLDGTPQAFTPSLTAGGNVNTNTPFFQGTAGPDGMNVVANPPLVGGVGSLTPNLQQPNQRVAQPVDDLTQAQPVYMNQAQAAPVAREISPQLSALFDVINYAEGSPGPNTLFGYGTFDNVADHPNKKVPYNQGQDFSTAAGFLQINKPTYDDILTRYAGEVQPGFDIENQKRIGAIIAQEEYGKKYPGRNLEADLASGDQGLITQAIGAMSGRWSSLPGGVQVNSQMRDLLHRFNESIGKYTQPPPVPAQPKGFADRPNKLDSAPVTNPAYEAAKNAAKASDVQSGVKTKGFADPIIKDKASDPYGGGSSYSVDKTSSKLSQSKSDSKSSWADSQTKTKTSSGSSGSSYSDYKSSVKTGSSDPGGGSYNNYGGSSSSKSKTSSGSSGGGFMGGSSSKDKSSSYTGGGSSSSKDKSGSYNSGSSSSKSKDKSK